MSTRALPPIVALVDETHSIDAADLAEVAGALSEQVTHDFAPIWHAPAAVVATPKPGVNQWALRIRAELDEPGALGYHTDAHGQPVSYIELTPDWPATVSHELLEMLADPFGNRMHQGRAPMDLDVARLGLDRPSRRVHYLLEVCDPCEATTYEVGGVRLSDFLLPGWYRTTPGQHLAYSHAGGCMVPRQVAMGGYVSFATDDGTWWQVFNDDGRLEVQNLGRFDRARYGTLREFSDRHAIARKAGLAPEDD